MAEDGATLPAVAPGQWTLIQRPDGVEQVRVTFEARSQLSAIAAQLDKWNASLILAQCTAIALPEFWQGAQTPELRFTAPEDVGPAFDGEKSPATVLKMLRVVATALDDLHAHGIVHGALGMSSLWWNADKQLQFPDAALAHTLEGLLKPSPAVYYYRSPEVWHGKTPLPASDQYSLAVMAYELFTGHSRADDHSVEGLVAIEPVVLEPKVLQQAGAPFGIAEILQRALASAPASRYENCTALVNALEVQMGKVERRRRNNPAGQYRNRKISFATVALGFLALGAIAGAITVVAHEDEARRIARSLRKKLPAINSEAGTAIGSVVPGTSVASSPASSSAPGAVTGAAPQAIRSARDGMVGVLAPATSPIAQLQRGVLGSETFQPGVISPYATVGALPRQITRETAFELGRDFAESVRSGFSRAAEYTAEKLDSLNPGLGRAIEGRIPVSASTTASIAEGVLASSDRNDAPVSAQSNSASRTNVAASNANGASGARSQPGSTNSSTNTPASGSASTKPAAASPASATILFIVPSGSRVFVDGVRIQVIDKKANVSPGLHDVDVVSQSGSTTRRRLTVGAGETVTVKLSPP